MEELKTRKVKGCSDWRCPCHGHRVVETQRRSIDDETGELKYGGTYFRCPEYSVCGYYVNVMNGRVPLVDEDGVRIGFSPRE